MSPLAEKILWPYALKPIWPAKSISSYEQSEFRRTVRAGYALGALFLVAVFNLHIFLMLFCAVLYAALGSEARKLIPK